MDVEKTIEFILATQARTEAVVGQLVDESLERGRRMDQQQLEINAIAGAIHALFARDEARGQQIQEMDARLTMKIDQLTEKIDQTTDNLNALITVVDGLRPRSNGHHAE